MEVQLSVFCSISIPLSFREVNAAWLDYMLTIGQFRNQFKKFILEYGESLQEEIRDDSLYKNAQEVKVYMDELTSCIKELDSCSYLCQVEDIPTLSLSTTDLLTQLPQGAVFVILLVSKARCDILFCRLSQVILRSRAAVI